MNPAPEDTIVAIATAPGEASVSIVRLSGSQALAIADQVFACPLPHPSERPSHTVVYGHVRGESGVVDESLMIIMRGPRSYTAEDVVELHGHGGSVCARRILRTCVDAGARLAEPGEFTKRAFLNGRIDLVQAEAVLDLIRSTSERASAAALEQLDGRLSDRFEDLYERVLMETARLEATLDFPEDELPEAVLPAIRSSLADIATDFTSLLDTWEEGHLLRDVLESERAIVSDIPGTTRDSIEEQLVIGGVPLRLVDTAGLRETADQVEQVGIERTRKLLEQADLHLVMFDLTEPVDLAELTDRNPANTIVLLNKSDMATNGDRPSPIAQDFTTIETSLLTGEGLSLLREQLLEKLSTNADLSARPQAVISERHRGLLDQSLADLNEAMELLGLNREDVIVLAAARCRDALETLGQATGKVYQEALLDRIFSSFCIGK